MTTLLDFDHAIIAVRSLVDAVDDFTALGFDVFPGGEHANRVTHNALIPLGDGSYLELLALTDPTPFDAIVRSKGALEAAFPDVAPDVRSSYRYFASGEGFIGYGLLSTGIEEAIETIRGRGLEVVGPATNSRERPDGERISWRGASLPALGTTFIIEDLTPRSLRVPGEESAVTHANHVTGLVNMVSAVHDLEASRARYAALLGSGPLDPLYPVDGAHTVDFAFKTARVTLAQPTGDDSPLRAHLEQRGETPYLLRLRTSDDSRDGLLSPVRTHGARIELVR